MTGRGIQSIFFFVLQRHSQHGNIVLRKIAGEYEQATPLRGTLVCNVLGMRRQPRLVHSCTCEALRPFECRRRLFVRSCPRALHVIGFGDVFACTRRDQRQVAACIRTSMISRNAILNCHAHAVVSCSCSAAPSSHHSLSCCQASSSFQVSDKEGHLTRRELTGVMWNDHWEAVKAVFADPGDGSSKKASEYHRRS